LASDMRILEVALQSESCELYGIDAEIEDAVSRFIARVKAIRQLHVEERRAEKAVTQ